MSGLPFIQTCQSWSCDSVDSNRHGIRSVSEGALCSASQELCKLFYFCIAPHWARSWTKGIGNEANFTIKQLCFVLRSNVKHKKNNWRHSRAKKAQCLTFEMRLVNYGLLHVHKYIIKFLHIDREEMHLYFVPTLTKSAVDHILVLFRIFQLHELYFQKM